MPSPLSGAGESDENAARRRTRGEAPLLTSRYPIVEEESWSAHVGQRAAIELARLQPKGGKSRQSPGGATAEETAAERQRRVKAAVNLLVKELQRPSDFQRAETGGPSREGGQLRDQAVAAD